MLAGGMAHEVGQLYHPDHTPCTTCLYAIVASFLAATADSLSDQGLWGASWLAADVRPHQKHIVMAIMLRSAEMR